MKVNIDIPEDMLEAIDDACKREYFNRSEWIRTAIRSKLFTPPEGIQPVTVSATTDENKIVKPLINETSTASLNIKIKWCDLHFERGATYECRLISWEDENGELRIDHKYACPKCYDKYSKLPVGTLYDH